MWKLLSQDRSLIVLLMLGLVALLVLVLATWGGDLPTPPNLRRPLEQTLDLSPLRRLESLFATRLLGRLIPSNNAPNPFFTRYFEPPPPPPPPATRKVKVVYQGFFQVADGPKRAFIAVDKSLKVVTPGTVVVADFAVADMDRNSLVLTNRAGVTNRLAYSAQKVLSVPAK